MYHSWNLTTRLLPFVAIALTLGCQAQTPPATTALSSPTSHDDHAAETADPTVAAVLAKLSLEDRQLAEAQKFCAVMNEQKLGSMGPPLKLIVNEQPVFVCCKGCERKAKSSPDKTLAKVRELKTKVKSETSH